MTVWCNSVKFAAHSIVLSFEVFLLVALVVGLAFPKLDFADRVFLRDPGVLRFQFDESSSQLARLASMRLYYTTKSDRQLSERQAVSLPVRKEAGACYEVRLPQGTLEFRLDTYFDDAGSKLESPPRIKTMTIDGRDVMGAWLKPFSFLYAGKTTIGYNYIPAPYFNGYLPEFLVVCTGIWLLLMLIFWIAAGKMMK